MTFEITIDTDVGRLADRLASSVAGTRQDPFASELVVVPSAGMQRWLEQQLSQRLGVAANIAMPFPARFTAEIKGAVGHTQDPWTIEAITAKILRAGGDPAGSEAFRDLLNAGSPLTRVPRARYIADLFDRYHVHRPAMISSWATNTGTTASDVDGVGQPLPAHQRWQPALWREVRGSLGPSPPERLPTTLEHIARAPLPTMPATVHVFGLAAMSPELRAIFEALASTTSVHVFTTVASWAMVDSEPPWHHALLNTWGKTQHQAVTALLSPTSAIPSVRPTLHRPPVPPPPSAPGTLLAAIQNQLRNNEPPAPVAFHASADTGDVSLRFHGCSGDARQIEVLRDAILRLLRDNPDLTEGDIAVMCPRLDRFAPLIEAIWGPSAHHSSTNSSDSLPALRYSINASSLRSAAPLLDGVARLLHLLRERITHSQLTTFLGLDPVQLRFGLTDAYDLATVTGWLESTAMRWGLNPEQRAAHAQLPADYVAHTLDTTSHAVLASLALPADEIVPDGPATIRVDLSSFELAGQMAEFVDSLTWAFATFCGEGPMKTWVPRILSAADRFFEVEPKERWQRDRLAEVLEDMAESATDTPLALVDVTALYVDAISTRPGHRTFGTGAIIVDAPKALRTVPHRALCVLGFDDDAVPKSRPTDDDLIAAAPLESDRSPIEDAKQQLLDAVLAARDHLVITFADTNIHTNAAIPPSVALQEFLDVASTTSGRPEKELIQRETRYAFSEKNFENPPRSFDGAACEASLARRLRPVTLDRSLPEPLEGLAPVTRISPNAIVRAATRPVDVFASETLEMRFPRSSNQPGDVLPVEIRGLEGWAVGNGLLTKLIEAGAVDEAGIADEAVIEAWRHQQQAAGQLPPGALGATGAIKQVEMVRRILKAIAGEMKVSGAELTSRLTPIPVLVDIVAGTTSNGDVRTITGAIDCRDGGPSQVLFSYLKASHELRLWVETLLLAEAGLGDRAWIIGQKANLFHCQIDTDNRAAIDDAVGYLVDLHGQARTRVVSLFPEVSKIAARSDDSPALADIQAAWFDTGRGYPAGDRTTSSVAAFFEQWSAEDLMQDELGVTDRARELWGHIRATTRRWGTS